MEDSLSNYISKCRCCLENVKGDTYLKMTKFAEERFFNFTSTSLTESDKLSTKICITCNSLLARYSALRKSFVENQNKLNKLLIITRSEAAEDDLIVKEPTAAYTITEPLEHVNEKPDAIQRIQIEEVHDPEIVQEKIPETESKSEFRKPKESQIKEFLQPCLQPILSERAAEQSIVNIKTAQMKKLNQLANPKARKLHRCNDCDYETNVKSSYLNHQWKVHDGSKPEFVYICEICSKGFLRHERLKRHLDHHSSIKRFFCDQCSFGTHAKNDLTKHLLTHLKSSDPRVCYKCEVDGCGAVYRWKVSLTNHVQSNHLKEKLIACQLCSKSFTREIMMKNHVRFVHYKERPFPCDVTGCEIAFSCKAHLNRHRKNIHTVK